uniref:Uncharacterized protein n=1 Tax=Anguilla anguilla TaxID=7936 RepID=A0A0E9XT15_ANGAN
MYQTNLFIFTSLQPGTIPQCFLTNCQNALWED